MAILCMYIVCMSTLCVNLLCDYPLYEYLVYEYSVYEDPVYEYLFYKYPVYEYPVNGSPVYGYLVYKYPVCENLDYEYVYTYLTLTPLQTSFLQLIIFLCAVIFNLRPCRMPYRVQYVGCDVYVCVRVYVHADVLYGCSY